MGTVTFGSIQSKVHDFMDLSPDNDYLIDLVLATALSVDLDRPVWLMVVAPPSSGKTELLKLLSEVGDVHIISTITNRALFSAFDDAKGGYMIREVKKKGILAFPDFTTVLDMNRNQRKEVFNQLRVIHDGEAGRGSGVDTGKMTYWKGKVAVIACVTEAIESSRKDTSELGERFMYFRYSPLSSPFKLFESDSLSARAEVYRDVKALLKQKSKMLPTTTVKPFEPMIASMAEIISIARAPVSRAAFSKEVEVVHHPEGLWRMGEGLAALLRSLLSLHDGSDVRPVAALKMVAKSCIPLYRVKIIEAATEVDGKLRISDFARAAGVPSNSIRMTLEDLCLQKVLEKESLGDGEANLYWLKEDFKHLWDSIFGSQRTLSQSA